MPELDDKASKAVEYVRHRYAHTPRIGVVLGSGLGPVADRLSGQMAIPYNEIPGFPEPSVEGHMGNLVLGELSGLRVAVMQGRFHHYEGHPMDVVTLPVSVLAGLGAGTLVITCASGGIRDDLHPGDIIAVTDHINLMGVNPLTGITGKGRFVDMTGAYDARLIEVAGDVSRERRLGLKRGVIAAVPGPCYETPAEVRMLGIIGADAVCMSTVPEVIMARYLGVDVLGLSLISNKAAGLSGAGPSHTDVIETTGKFHQGISELIAGFAARLRV